MAFLGAAVKGGEIGGICCGPPGAVLGAAMGKDTQVS